MWTDEMLKKNLKAKAWVLRTTISIHILCDPHQNTFYLDPRNIKKKFFNQKLDIKKTVLHMVNDPTKRHFMCTKKIF